MTAAIRRFVSRWEAGERLAAALASAAPGLAVVAGIPRGGVIVARAIANRLRSPLTVVYSRKLGVPFDPEFAFGVVDEDGEVTSDPETVCRLRLDEATVARVAWSVMSEIERRMRHYRVRPLAHFLPGRHVVLVDDGLATGLTMGAAVAYARRHGAHSVTVAVPCASLPAAERFRREADRFVSLVIDPRFEAVGAYYADFRPVSDDAVVAALAEPPVPTTTTGKTA